MGTQRTENPRAFRPGSVKIGPGLELSEGAAGEGITRVGGDAAGEVRGLAGHALGQLIKGVGVPVALMDGLALLASEVSLTTDQRYRNPANDK